MQHLRKFYEILKKFSSENDVFEDENYKILRKMQVNFL